MVAVLLCIISYSTCVNRNNKTHNVWCISLHLFAVTGFSKTLIQILNDCNAKFSSFDILSDESVRQGWWHFWWFWFSTWICGCDVLLFVLTVQYFSTFYSQISSFLGRLPKVNLIILEGEKCPSVRPQEVSSIWMKFGI